LQKAINFYVLALDEC